MVIYLAALIKMGLLSVYTERGLHPDFRVHSAATTGVFSGVLD